MMTSLRRALGHVTMDRQETEISHQDMRMQTMTACLITTAVVIIAPTATAEDSAGVVATGVVLIGGVE